MAVTNRAHSLIIFCRPIADGTVEIAPNKLRLHDLACRGHRHVIHDHKMLRPSKLGKMLFCKIALELIEIKRCTRFQDDETGSALTQDLIGQRRDRDLRNRRVVGDRDLDVDRIEFDAAAIDQFLGAASRASHCPSRIHRGEIAGTKPAVASEAIFRRLLVGDIAGEQRAAANMQLALFAGRQARYHRHRQPAIRCRALRARSCRNESRSRSVGRLHAPNCSSVMPQACSTLPFGSQCFERRRNGTGTVVPDRTATRIEDRSTPVEQVLLQARAI